MSRTQTLWTFAITSIALFMVTLDNLVVTTAIPVIHKDLNASLSSLEWTVNAYTLTFAVLLLTGAALGDRFGRRRVFALGVGIFTAGSIAAALAPSVEFLNVARAVQGFGGAIVMPLTLTILSAAVPAEKRGLALGAWGGISGLAVAFGPLVGGAVVQGIAWQWIFWLNVPVGLTLIPLAIRRPPIRSERAPAIGATKIGIAVQGRIRRPEPNGEYPCTVWKNWASRKIEPNMPKYMKSEDVFASAKAGLRKNRIGSIGDAVRSSQATNAATKTAPIANARMISGLVQPSSFPRTRPQTTPKRPTLARPTPGRSSLPPGP